MGIFGRMMGKTEPGKAAGKGGNSRPPANSTQFAASQSRDPATGAHAVRKELLKLVMRETLARNGIPESWLSADLLRTNSPKGEQGRNCGLLGRHWDPRRLQHGVALEQEKVKPLDSLSESGLLARAERLRECRRVRGDAIKDAVSAADAELARRRESGSPAAWAPGTNVSTFEEAVSAYAPSLKLSANSKDLAVLDTPEAAEGRAVLLEGIVGEGLTENIGIIQIGERRVFLLIPPK